MRFRRKGIYGRVVEADEGGILGGGFSIGIKDQFRLLYQEDDHVIKVGTEPLRGNAGRVVYLLAVQGWESPYQNERLAEDQVYKVRQNILAALKFLGVKFESNWLPSSQIAPLD